MLSAEGRDRQDGLDRRDGKSAHPALPARPALPAYFAVMTKCPRRFCCQQDFVLLGAERLFLALADDRDAARPARRGSPGSPSPRSRGAMPSARLYSALPRESQCPSTRDLRARPPLHPVRVLLQRRPRVVADRRLVEIEEHVVERPLGVQLIERLAREDLLLGQRRRRRRGGRRRRRRWRWRRRRRRRGRRRRRRRRGAAAEPSCGSRPRPSTARQRKRSAEIARTRIMQSHSWSGRQLTKLDSRCVNRARCAKTIQCARGTPAARHGARRSAPFLVPRLPLRSSRRSFDARRSGRSGARILDCGCGTGANLELLERFGRAYGFDLSDGRPAISAAKPGRTRLARATVTAAPFPSGAFDLVTSFDVLYSLEDADERAAVAEMFRLLKPGRLRAGQRRGDGHPARRPLGAQPRSAPLQRARRSGRLLERGRLRDRAPHVHERRRCSCRSRSSARCQRRRGLAARGRGAAGDRGAAGAGQRA